MVKCYSYTSVTKDTTEMWNCEIRTLKVYFLIYSIIEKNWRTSLFDFRLQNVREFHQLTRVHCKKDLRQVQQNVKRRKIQSSD